MNLDRTQNRIIDLLSIFRLQIENATAMSRTDINRVSEVVLVPLFAEVFGYKNLKNLNDTEQANFPGIDLADETARVAIQVTSSSNNEKIKDTLHKFVKHELYKKYDRLIVYILTRKQNSYSGSGHAEIIQSKFTFDKNEDIKDYRDLLKVVKGFQIDRARKVENILEANFGNRNTGFSIDTPAQGTEDVFLNLVGVSFPETIYVADLIVDRDEVTKNSRVDGGAWLKRTASTRDVAQAALKQQGLSFPVDWECHANQVVTFHDLYNEDLRLTKIIDQGTVTPLASKRYYTVDGKVDGNRENVFKSLLRRCLQQKLFPRHVQWQNQDNLFIFMEQDDEPIRYEQWYGERESERKVYERTMKNNKPYEILGCKHLAFATQFKRFEDKWYLILNPDWFFSWNGYKRSIFADEKLKWIKKEEDNKQVFNHFRFLVYFLTHEEPSNLFEQKPTYRFLHMGDITKFNTAPILDDQVWNPPKTKEVSDDANEEDLQAGLDFSL
jgi:hypothetical protein